MKFEIIHVLPGKQEVKVTEVETFKDVSAIVDTAKYAGTWLTPTKKLLRFGRGEIHIREIDIEPRVIQCREITVGPFTKLYELEVKNGYDLQCIILNERMIAGYRKFYYESERDDILWTVNSFTQLANQVGKEVAYQVKQHYERYCREFDIPEVM